MLLVQSVYCVEFEITQAEIQVASIPKATDIRRQYYDRLKPCYAEYDHHESAVYLGMGKASGMWDRRLHRYSQRCDHGTARRRFWHFRVYGFVVYSKNRSRKKRAFTMLGTWKGPKNLCQLTNQKSYTRLKPCSKPAPPACGFMCDMPHETKVKFSLRGD